MAGQTMLKRVADAILKEMDIADSLDGSAAERYARAALKAMPMPTAVQLEAAWQESLKIAAECGGGVDRAQLIHVAERHYDAMMFAAVSEMEGCH